MKLLCHSRDVFPLSTVEGSELLHFKKEDKTLPRAWRDYKKCHHTQLHSNLPVSDQNILYFLKDPLTNTELRATGWPTEI